MRHVMALRVSKAVLVFAIALFYTILVLNNITDYRSNYEFVRHVLMMDSTFPGNHLMWRAVNSPLVHTVFYIGIIAWESVTMLLCWWGGVRLLKSYRADRAQFAAALNIAVIALTTSLLMWLVAFLDVGGEWFLMWQSQIWNGQEEAFRMFAIVGVVLLVVVQREPTPDKSRYRTCWYWDWPNASLNRDQLNSPAMRAARSQSDRSRPREVVVCTQGIFRWFAPKHDPREIESALVRRRRCDRDGRKIA